MDEEKLHYLDQKDPLFSTKNTSIQSHNQIVALIKENKKNIYDKVYYIFSLLFAIITALYSPSPSYFSFLIILNICTLLLIYPAWQFYMRRRELANKKHRIESSLNQLGITLN